MHGKWGGIRGLVALGMVLMLLASVVTAWAAGETGTFTGLGPYATIKGSLNGVDQSLAGGTMKFQLTNGPLVSSFCTDLLHHVSTNDTFVASTEIMPCSIRWLLLHYPPRLSGYTPWPDRPGALADIKQEMAARQAAVWHFSDGFNPYITTTVGARAWQIIDEVNALTDPCAADFPNVALTPVNTVAAAGDTVSLVVRLTQGNEPVAGRVVTLATSLGTLSEASVTTDVNGEATFTLSSAVVGSSRITATAQMSLPVGTIFVGTNPDKQKLVLGQQASGPVAANATVLWVSGGTLAVHLFNDLNLDGASQDGESGLSGWTVTVQGQSSRTTDAAGNASWSLPVGLYTVVLTQKSGWYATTPISVQVFLSADEIVTVNFGQIIPPALKVQVFQDQDLNAAYTAGEGGVAGWMVGLYRQDGSQAAGWNALTDAEGWVYFSNLPNRTPDIIPGAYYVVVSFPEGWYATGGASRSFTLSAGEIHAEYVGGLAVGPALTLVGVAGDTPNGETHFIHAGETVVYQYQVQNTGNTYLKDVQITDAVYGPICTMPGLLAPGATQTCVYTTTVAASVVNLSTATGQPALADGTELAGWSPVSASDEATVEVIHPALALTLADVPLAHVGDTLTYQVTVENTGDTALSGLTYGGDLSLSGCPTALEAGESVVCTGTRPVLAGDPDPLLSTVTVAGQDLLGATVTAQDTTTTDILHPALELTVTGLTQAHVLDVLAYTLTLYNPGDALTNLVYTGPANFSTCPTLLPAGATATCVVYHQVKVGDGDPYQAAFSVTGRDALGAPATAHDSVTTDILHPMLTLSATGPAQAHVGDTLAYTLTLHNPGDPLTNLTYSGPADFGACPTILAAGATATCVVYHEVQVSDGDPYRAAFLVTGEDALGGLASAQADVTTDILHPALELTASGPAQAHANDLLHYTLTLHNLGDALHGIILTGDATFSGCPTSLAAGQTVVCSATRLVMAADADPFMNAFAATGEDALGGLASAQASVTTDILWPGIQITITAPVTVTAGMSIPYTIVVHNTSDVALTNVVVADALTGFTWQGALAAGESRTFETIRPTQPTDSGLVVNPAQASGRDPLGQQVSDSSSATTQVVLADSDGDGIPDVDEVEGDADGDGLPNYVDADSDGDGIPDTVEGSGDADGDGSPDYLDADSDGDGIPDAVEGAGDADGDGLPNYLDADSDGDGIPDGVEGASDADGDGLPNFLDADSDGDGIADQLEWTVDSDGDGLPNHDVDGDGLPNFLDADSDNDGIPDAVEGAGDADGDGIPNFVDLDSDGDGIPDAVEGAGDADGDGAANFLDLDSDGDGIPDAGEYSTGANDPLQGCTANDPLCTNNDVDGDGILNYLDTDSDGDGIADLVEGTGDDDQDGIPNYLDNQVTPLMGRFKLYLPLVCRDTR